MIPTSIPPGIGMTFLTQPVSAEVNKSIPKLLVAVLDNFGYTVPNAMEQVAIEIDSNSNPNGGVLSGTTLVTPIDGVATFSDLKVDKSGDSYALFASGSGLGMATSGLFNVAGTATED